MREGTSSMDRALAAQCGAQLDLRRPVASERVRGFQPPWYTVYVYRCPVGHEIRVRASAFRGSRSEPAVGAILCPHLRAGG
jgi:hypothetical protein